MSRWPFRKRPSSDARPATSSEPSEEPAEALEHPSYTVLVIGDSPVTPWVVREVLRHPACELAGSVIPAPLAVPGILHERPDFALLCDLPDEPAAVGVRETVTTTANAPSTRIVALFSRPPNVTAMAISPLSDDEQSLLDELVEPLKTGGR